MKKILVFMLIFIFSVMGSVVIHADVIPKSTNNDYKLKTANFEINAKSALLMEAETGTILYSKNESTSASPASVTKIMTLLLVMEAIDNGSLSLTDNVYVSANAASKGGSQVFLKEGEKISVEDLVKCTVIASANDAAVALAETVSGSESEFVNHMNERAKKLGMKNTNFENATGLDDTTVNHVTSALDIAIMSRALIKHDLILKYSSLWQDTIRNGEFTLTNTNRLVRFYDGCNGLKTGSTDKAGFCISTTAKRDGMQLIAVIMGAETRDERNTSVRTLLDFGFSNFYLFSIKNKSPFSLPVKHGYTSETSVYCKDYSQVINKSDKNRIREVYELPDYLIAPIENGNEIGKIKIEIDGKSIGETPVYVKFSVEKIGVLGIFLKMLHITVSGEY